MQAKVEAREALRKLILSLNGLAGLYILKEKVKTQHIMYLVHMYCVCITVLVERGSGGIRAGC